MQTRRISRRIQLTSILLVAPMAAAVAVQPSRTVPTVAIVLPVASPMNQFQAIARKAQANWPSSGSFSLTVGPEKRVIRFAGSSVSIVTDVGPTRIGSAWVSGESYVYQDVSQNPALQRTLMRIGKPFATWMYTKSENLPQSLSGVSRQPMDALEQVMDGANRVSRTGSSWVVAGICGGSSCTSTLRFDSRGRLSYLDQRISGGGRSFTISPQVTALALISPATSYHRSELTG